MTEKHIRFDWAIKRLLRQKANFGILEGFLSELLREDVRIAELLESESNKETEGDKFNRVDILVKDSAGRLMLVEVQVEKEHDYFHRMCYGQAKLIAEHIGAGSPYAGVKKVHSVNVVYFDLGHGEDYLYEGTTEFRGLRKGDRLRLNEKQRGLYGLDSPADIFPTYHLIKANSFDDVARDTLDEWVYFLKNSVIKDEFRAKGLAEAREKLRADNLGGDEKIAYENYAKSERIRLGEIQSAYHDGRADEQKALAPLLEEAKQREQEALRVAEEARKREEALLSMMAKMLSAQGKSAGQIAAALSISLGEAERLLGL
jgi:predicted transposase/invertase (TIGR01784 family)